MRRHIYIQYKVIIDFLLNSRVELIRNIAAKLVYDEIFYKEPHDFKSRSAQAIAQIIVNKFSCKSVFDIGCGVGLFIAEIGKMGVSVLGCDSSDAAIKNKCAEVDIFKADASKRIAVGKKFDIVICFEVAEHLPENASFQLVENCVRHSEKILFTAAPPGQSGVGHINEQPCDYWIEKFAALGYYHNKDVSNELSLEMRNQNVVKWIADNIMYYEKMSGLS